jgi:hypothetical protein
MGLFRSKKSTPATSTTSSNNNDQQTEDEVARQRLAEETKRIALETSQQRTQAANALIDGAAGVDQRKEGVAEAVETYSKKGTTTLVDQDVGDTKIQQQKIALASNLQKFAEKGKAAPTTTTGALRHDLKKTFETATPDDLPTLFQAKSLSTNNSSTANTTTSSYASDFAVVENQVTTMVGEETHVKTTGLDQQGRRVTKTKIILPKQTAATVSQQQRRGTPKSTATATESASNAFDYGTYISLVDLRQKRVPGIDKHNQEKYLSPEEFQKAFQMTKDEFAVLPKWKRDKLKRGLHIY